ncbi:hypothetical protein Mp_5g06590 [Marchantia polymorpha subsp. ruderalis]|uniref:Uncharacterized protein n=2 Tax=Marchantia polymorpha TaxID=3197 RepID=A0AAF6BFM6_MARPO|nr:hypothetical protein MARPO_0171s0024 [Marchantia polymorpha]BBN10810.1 hypothetical protein Mp_5g06590 [Marchantia polymorpha subsp. ruderalis]|eukprot:PTQ28182.1 hypothetical protein MARPO_0171s0024 [Marchantia polymorpha]
MLGRWTRAPCLAGDRRGPVVARRGGMGVQTREQVSVAPRGLDRLPHDTRDGGSEITAANAHKRRRRRRRKHAEEAVRWSVQ